MENRQVETLRTTGPEKKLQNNTSELPSTQSGEILKKNNNKNDNTVTTTVVNDSHAAVAEVAPLDNQFVPAKPQKQDFDIKDIDPSDADSWIEELESKGLILL